MKQLLIFGLLLCSFSPIPADALVFPSIEQRVTNLFEVIFGTLLPFALLSSLYLTKQFLKKDSPRLQRWLARFVWLFGVFFFYRSYSLSFLIKCSAHSNDTRVNATSEFFNKKFNRTTSGEPVGGRREQRLQNDGVSRDHHHHSKCKKVLSVS
jgi:hypothetical protein